MEAILNKQTVKTIVEWAHCIVSPRHAKDTWLRISDEAEQKALKIVKAVVIVIIAGAIFVGGIAIGEYRMINLIDSGRAPVSTEL
jgi:hypothetical protein